ncbi:Rv1733c family protein [Mycolicibacterium sp. 120320]|uniref:Rv1733c family protein n=2 Tax=unclassified Mycolicibacterium TaxID=2636767 RepID=UPI003FA5EF99
MTIDMPGEDVGLCRRDVGSADSDDRRALAGAAFREEAVMDEYTWSAKPCLLSRYVGRHPLVRRSDRLEAWVILIASLVVVLTVPFAAAIGTATHDRQLQVALQQAAERHTAVATVTDGSTFVAQPGRVTFGTPVRWSVGPAVHTGWLEGVDRLKPGDRATVWVNDFGEQVGPPLSRGQATTMAIASAALAWLVVVAVLSAAVRVVQWHLNRSRYAEWTREWQLLDRDGNGRRENRRP